MEQAEGGAEVGGVCSGGGAGSEEVEFGCGDVKRGGGAAARGAVEEGIGGEMRGIEEGGEAGGAV